MPLIHVSMFPGRSEAQKQAFVEKIVAACKEDFGSSNEDYIWVVFDEKSTDNWFAGKKSFTKILAERSSK